MPGNLLRLFVIHQLAVGGEGVGGVGGGGDRYRSRWGILKQRTATLANLHIGCRYVSCRPSE